MPSSLVIVESPAKVKTLSKILGKGYIIKASMGHVRDLPKIGLGIKITPDLKFEPKYQILPEKKDIINELTKVAKEVKKIFLAPDPDREGEAIAWHLYNIFESKKINSTIKRIQFNEITKDAILKAIEVPQDINLNKVNAQQTRRLLDRLVGYKISPILWQKIRKGLSAGRVQSVAVRLICEREQEIENFTPKEYWTIKEILGKDKSKSYFEAELVKYKNKKLELKNETETNSVVNELKELPHVIKKINTTKQKKSPPPPFITSTLQQEASKLLNFSVKKTMNIAQELYEGLELGNKGPVALITYMRTDSIRVSDEAKSKAKDFIIKNYGKEFVPKEVRKFKAKSNIQDAHEAIRPTDITLLPEKIKEYVPQDHYKLYKLIWNRFIASQMSDAIYDNINLEIQAQDYLLKASSSNLEFLGFQIVYKNEEEQQNKYYKLLSKLKEGDILIVKDIIPTQHFTQPPSRYSEATLVKELEEKGIGRPSTYAPTISIIQERGYVKKEGKFLVPTVLGKQVNEQLINHFNEIINVNFTAEMENILDKIELGELEWQDSLVKFYVPFTKILDKAKQNMVKTGVISEEKCEICGNEMVIKTGRYGDYLLCTNEECKHTKKLLKKIGIKCPNTECDGEIIEKKSQKGFIFYACNKFPSCKFASFDQPTNLTCPKCNSYTVIKFNKQKKPFIVCSNKECKNILKFKRKSK